MPSLLVNRSACVLLLAVGLLGCAEPGEPDDIEAFRGGGAVAYQGIVETGLNRYLGAALYDWTTGAGLFGGNMLGQFNEQGSQPIPLDDSTPGDAVLSTFIDLDFQAAMGLPPEAIDHAGENLPLQEALVQVGPSVNARQSLQGMFDTEPYTVSRSFPHDTITLDDWNAAKGTLRIKCHDDGTATLTARLRHLIPNGLYTLWQVTTPPIGSPMPFGLLPAGGVPNAWVADIDGRGKFRREIDHCPNDDGVTLSYQVAYHADGSMFGAFPDAPGNGLYGGTVTIEQMVFPISVDVL